jgi:hypothetical protein
MEKYKWSFAKVETEELDLFGNIDWALPSVEDLEKIVNSYQTRFWTENQFEWLLWSDGFAGNPIKGTCEDNCEGMLQPVYRF